MLIVYRVPYGAGWSPITYMVNLAVELFEAELLLLDVETWDLHRPWQLTNFFGRQKNPAGEDCLMICTSPTDLLLLLAIPNWRHRFRTLSAWIIDSFWIEWIPQILRWSHPFDHLFVTTEEDTPTWQRVTRTPITWLPWGTDALRLGGDDPIRPWDVLRVGRQPAEWDDDLSTEQVCLNYNLRFHGRPPIPANPQENQTQLMQLYRQSKFLLAFSNTVNPTSYTHPSRQYLTGRWVDALACGTSLVGVPPKEPSIQRLLWPGATIDLQTVQRQQGLSLVADAVRQWTPQQATNNYRYALNRLDWRWRFATIAQYLQRSPHRLQDELALLHQKIQLLKPVSEFEPVTSNGI